MKIKLLIFILISSSILIYSQDEDLDQLPYDDTPKKALGKTSSYKGVAELGYKFNFSLINFDDINNLIASENYGMNKFEWELILSGAKMSFYIPFINNTKVGLFYLNGAALTKEKDIIKDEINLKTYSELSLKMVGVSIDYGYVPMTNFALTFGVNLGFIGNMNIDLNTYAAENNWVDIETGNNLNEKISLSKNFMQLQPSFGIEWAPTKFLMLRLNTYYNYTFTDILSESGWKVNGLGNINDVPLGINPDAMNISLGIYIGVFNFESLRK